MDSGRGNPVLDVRHVSVSFETHDGTAQAVNDVSFTLHAGESLGLVGESGCGKSVTALAIMRLIRDPGRIHSGEILFQHCDLLTLSEREMREIRGKSISMVFQEPMTALNPVFTIGDQLTEVMLLHERKSWSDAQERSLALLRRVGIQDPDTVMISYPHQLSGGMRQRVLIAMALVCTPVVLIADEPTSAIDVTAQAQVLHLINELRLEYGMAVLMITHDLGVVAETCDRVAIMYASHIVETAPVHALFSAPRHPYTQGLLRSIPSLHVRGERLTIIPGQVPRPTMYPEGCNFQSRCTRATEQCVLHEPRLIETDSGHAVACWNPLPAATPGTT
ncbi:MAG TPA: ABC transporter ATP-binding protein [Bacteroidota bacterium]|nr:ABC transporter ATP-binding protein [Bacteroidota bacterium]